ncbi:hypothetical protein ES707_08691 [subsurface metagenome]
MPYAQKGHLAAEVRVNAPLIPQEQTGHHAAAPSSQPGVKLALDPLAH